MRLLSLVRERRSFMWTRIPEKISLPALRCNCLFLCDDDVSGTWTETKSNCLEFHWRKPQETRIFMRLFLLRRPKPSKIVSLSWLRYGFLFRYAKVHCLVHFVIVTERRRHTSQMDFERVREELSWFHKSHRTGESSINDINDAGICHYETHF